MKKIIGFLSILVIILIIIFVGYQFDNDVEDEDLIYYEPKLYPILDENYPPYKQDSEPIENPQVRLLSKTDKGIVLEFIDSTFIRPEDEEENLLNTDTFYCILTEDRVLKYFNGYIQALCYSLDDNEKIEELGLSEIAADKENLNNIFQFRELYREYSVNLSKIQYNKIIKKLRNINENFMRTSGYNFTVAADRSIYRGLCFKAGYFDAQDDIGVPKAKGYNIIERTKYRDESIKKFHEMYDDLYTYIQSLIPELEVYQYEI